MDGLMMDRPLLIKRLLWRAEHVFGANEIVTRTDEGYHRYTYADLAHRVRKLAGALQALGVEHGDRVATLAWNSYRHLECYFAVPGVGAVLHTANSRLSPEQLAHTINHAKDKVVFVDPDLIPLLEAIHDQIPTVEQWVVLGERPESTTLSPMHSYEELVADAVGVDELPEFDENTAAGLCYTSGTTGDPKGVLYSHRSTVLHALGLSVKGSAEVSADESFLVLVPMSHVNAWGMPYACAMQGARLLLPGAHPTATNFVDIIHEQHATTVVGAVTVGLMIRDAWVASGRKDLSSVRRLWLGGQAPPSAMIKWWAEHNQSIVVNAWGMTETSPLATFNNSTSAASLEERSRQGKPVPLVELRIVGEDGNELPWDGKATGELEIRAPWVAREYYKDDRSATSFHDGWLRTGDISSIYPDGSMLIKDRTKDLVKSGGEWISSVDLENALMAHPMVHEAVVIAISDEKWLERPLAYVHRSGDVSAEELRTHLSSLFARFWVPEQILFVEEIPKTSVGKFDKKRLRAAYQASGDRTARPG